MKKNESMKKRQKTWQLEKGPNDRESVDVSLFNPSEITLHKGDHYATLKFKGQDVRMEVNIFFPDIKTLVATLYQLLTEIPKD